MTGIPFGLAVIVCFGCGFLARCLTKGYHEYLIGARYWSWFDEAIGVLLVLSGLASLITICLFIAFGSSDGEGRNRWRLRL